MAYQEGQLDGSADFRVGINVWYINSNNAGNFSTFGWDVRLTTPQQYGTWSGDTQTWNANIGGQARSGTFKLSYENRFTNTVYLASGTVDIAHDGEGWRSAFPSSAAITTNHSSVGSGWSGAANVDAPRIAKYPTAPRNVAVQSVLPTSATIRWDAPADTRGSAITQYLVRVSTTSPADTAPYTDTTLSASARSHTLTGLKPGTTYYVVVYAKNGASWSNSGYSPKSAQVAPRTMSGAYHWTGSTWAPAEVLTFTTSGWKSGEVQGYTSTGWKQAS